DTHGKKGCNKEVFREPRVAECHNDRCFFYQKVRRLAVAIVALFIILEGVWFVVLSEGLIRDLLEGAFENDYVYLRSEGFKKGLFYNFSADKILLAKKKGGQAETVLLGLNDVRGRLDFLSIFTFKPHISLRCRLNDGEIEGIVGLTRQGSTTISGSEIHMTSVPFLEPLGIHAEGVLSGSFSAKGNTGELRVLLSRASFRNSSLGGVFLPLETFHEVRGAATITDGVVELQSLALLGHGVYGRVRGDVRGGNMNMSFELMAEPSFRLQPLLQAMVEQYKVSPGYYVIPLRGDIPR
ncbi:MAG TPA: type II secretion system protein GspN, partial [Thermodesulfovibrionales bacterium]|nr:type II secretion system protein GspN [Thermodesulfovibrionales bacterium]